MPAVTLRATAVPAILGMRARWRGNSSDCRQLARASRGPRPPHPRTSRWTSPSSGVAYTGLWTAYYLSGIDPHLRIAVLGAGGGRLRGRRDATADGVPPSSPPRPSAWRAAKGTKAMHRLRRALQETVDAGRCRRRERGTRTVLLRRAGSTSLARSEAQVARARAEIESLRGLRIGEDDGALVRAATEARDPLVPVAGARRPRAIYTPHLAPP